MMDLEWIIDPVSRSEFLNEYFEKKPLVIKREQRKFFDPLLKLQDIDTILERGTRSGRLEVVMVSAQKKIPLTDYLQSRNDRNASIRNGFAVDQLLRLFSADKATLIINSSKSEWEPVRDLSENIDRDLLTQSGANIFLTPSHAQCFEAHFDEHDLFILQVYGRKRWRIFESAQYLPLEPQGRKDFDFSKLKLLHEIDVEAGDTVYFPRGYVHEVITTDSPSLHITLGVMNPTWAKVVSDWMLTLMRNDETLRSICSHKVINKEQVVAALDAKIREEFTVGSLNMFAEQMRRQAGKSKFSFAHNVRQVNA